jgi:hypothetical protein
MVLLLFLQQLIIALLLSLQHSRIALLLFLVRYRIALLFTRQQIMFLRYCPLTKLIIALLFIRNVLRICNAAIFQVQDRVTIVIGQIQNCIAVVAANNLLN